MRLAEQLRQRAPQRLEGYTAASMLELTAAEFAHDRGLRETAGAAANALTACVDGSPYAYGYQQPLLEQARALAESE